MSIPLRKEHLQLILVEKDKILKPEDNLLLEIAHAFDNQYTWALEIANDAYQSLINNIHYKEIHFEKSTPQDINGVFYNIEKTFLPTNANIYSFTTEGVLKINIYIQIATRYNKTKEEIIQEIYNVIVHELSHGNVFWKQYISKSDYENIPQWYTIVQQTLLKHPDNEIYSFGYSMYSTVPHETQAIISQTWAEINKTNLNRTNFYDRFKETTAYQAFSSNVCICQKFLNNKQTREKITKFLEDNNIHIKNITKFVKKMEKTSHNAIKDALNNTYCFSGI